MSAAVGTGITMNDIMQAAYWSSKSVFRRFYYRPSHNTIPMAGQCYLQPLVRPEHYCLLHVLSWDMCGSTSRSKVKLQTTPLICETESSFPNGSDHEVIACYLELYEEGEVEHINGPTHPCPLV